MTPHRRIRVLRVIARLNIGGPALHVAALADLDPDRFETLLIHGSLAPGEQDMSDLLNGSPARVEFLPELGRALNAWQDVKAFSRVAGLIRQFEPDIVHSHTAKAGTLGRLAGAWSRSTGRVRCRLVHTFHGHVFHGYFSPAKSRAVIAVERQLTRLSDRILAVSEQVRTDLVDRYRIARPEKVTVVPLGLDLDAYLRVGRVRRIRTELQIGDDVFLIGCIGRLTAIKNHELLFEALQAARSRGLERFVLAIVGDGDRRRALEEAADRCGLGAHVRFLGWRRDLPSIYESLDAAVLSSLNEGTPVSLIEAMASARPVVATAVGGVTDVVEQGVHGFTVPSGDANAFAEALLTLAGDERRRQTMGAAGRQRAAERYSKQQLLRRMTDVYDQLTAVA